MKKRSLIFLFLLLFASPSYAQVHGVTGKGVTMKGVGAVAAPAGTWYYPGTETFASTATLDAQYPLAGKITVTTGGNCSKLSYKVNNLGAATKCKMGLFLDGASPQTLIIQIEDSSPSAGSWKDVTITPTAVSSSTAYNVFLVCDANVTDYHSTAVGAGYYMFDNGGYTSFYDSAHNNNANADYQEAVRMYVE